MRCKAAVLRLMAAVIALSFARPLFATPYTWNGSAGDNNWNNPLNWMPNGVPTSTDDVSFPISASPSSGSAANVSNSATLAIGSSLGVYGTSLTNSGTVTIGGSSITGSAYLEGFGSGTTTLSGGGSITLTSQTYSYFEVAGSGTLVNADNTIDGAGYVYAASGTFVNSGTIVADAAGSTLTLEGTNFTNSGTFAAANGGTLAIDTILNNGAGTIVALSGSTIVTSGGVIEGGTLETVGTGSILATPSATLVLQGTINNLDTLTVGGSSTLGAAYLENSDSGTTTLSGGGSVELTAQDYSYLEVVSGGTLVNADNTIHGTGFVYAANGALINNALISADVGGSTLTLEGANFTNNATLEAANGGTLAIATMLSNGSGTIEALAGSTVVTSGGVIEGGTLETVGTGSILATPSATLILQGTINNLDTLTVGGSSILGAAYLENSGSGTTTLSGGGSVALTAQNYSYLEVVSGGTLVNADNTIHGTGFIYAATGSFINNALIAADVGGSTLTLEGADFINNGTIATENGATLAIATTLSNSAGTIEALSGSAVVTSGGVIEGGTLETVGSGSILATPSATLVLQDTINNLDTLTVGGSSILGAAYLENSGSGTTTLSGGGSVELTAQDYSYLEVVSGGTLVNADNTIHGTGFVYAANGALINNGTILADVGGSTLTLEGGPVTNNGTFAASNGATLAISASTFTNLSGTTLTGGTFEVDANSAIVMSGTVTTNAANIVIKGTGTHFDAIENLANNSGSLRLSNGAKFAPGAATFSNSGTVTIDPTSELDLAAYVQTDGLTLVDGTLSASGGVLLNGGLLKGIGLIAGAVDNEAGTVSPGDSPGTLSVLDDYTQGAGGTLEIELAGTGSGQFDVLSVGGNALIDGTLDVTLLNGFVPMDGETFTVLTSLGLSGEFAHVNAPASVNVTYEGNNVVLLGATVPEPASLGLVAAGGMMLFGRRRRVATGC
jgi:fibronectin-binding autotransporter adhesin